MLNVGNGIRTPTQTTPLRQLDSAANPPRCSRCTGHSTADTFTAARSCNAKQGACGQQSEEEKTGFLKQLLEKLLPILQQLLGQQGAQPQTPQQQ